jgi:hypothetical protein
MCHCPEPYRVDFRTCFLLIQYLCFAVLDCINGNVETRKRLLILLLWCDIKETEVCPRLFGAVPNILMMSAISRTGSHDVPTIILLLLETVGSCPHHVTY